jgi:cell division protein FtsB
MRKRMYVLPAGVILFILFFTIFGDRGLLRIYHLKQEREELQKKADDLQTENEQLKREIEALKTDRRYLESLARKDFGLVRPNEVIYQFPNQGADKDAVQPPAVPLAPAAATSPTPAAKKQAPAREKKK